jgi:hypothetical protein
VNTTGVAESAGYCSIAFSKKGNAQVRLRLFLSYVPEMRPPWRFMKSVDFGLRRDEKIIILTLLKTPW